METLATVVFERTPLGAVAIKSTGDEVPRRLRTLLLAVDGRSPVSQYVPFLTAFAPLSEKFSELEKMGYLRRKQQAAASGATRTEISQETVGAQGSAALEESALTAFAASLHLQSKTPVAAVAADANDANDAFALELQVLSRQMVSLSKSPVAASSPQPAQDQKQAGLAPAGLPAILAEMEGFLSRAAGLDGLPIVMMLEQIQSLEQLRRELPSYVELVKPYGEEAQRHLACVAQLMRDSGGQA